MRRIMLTLAVVSFATGAVACDDRYPACSEPGAHLRSAPSLDYQIGYAVGYTAVGAPTAAVRAMVDAAASTAGVPIALAHRVVSHESGYRPRVRGRAGEYGLGQIKCQTARGIGFAGPCHALYDAETNLKWSMKYLRMAIDYGGPTCAGVSRYNMGIGAPPLCTHYGRKIMARRA